MQKSETKSLIIHIAVSLFEILAKRSLYPFRHSNANTRIFNV